jgi:hypothetical protein
MDTSIRYRLYEVAVHATGRMAGRAARAMFRLIQRSPTGEAILEAAGVDTAALVRKTPQDASEPA